MASATAPLAENKRLARRIPEDVATDGNFDLIDEICAEDIVEHGAFGEAHGREEFRQQVEGSVRAMDDFSATVEDVIAEGDTVAMRVTLRGTQNGEFMGVEPTGKRIEIDNMVFTRIEDGKIAERWALPDMLGAMRQLGAVDVPEQA